ncbi:hypothetical protein [Moorena sp. SIO4A5]|uniref:hypothetical protein n=1 Tax=Moorena sp. SIO4A5 TaxID=2607838 RepID=UPI0013CDA692|nr:hypothetical protein [Moorena sp. SIO4A5]NEO24833.1 hypothetical protein [Moorena sp. SIO4A5]NEO44745.1 hypothetical protein [Moorena sp. SIO4A3]
MRSRSVTFPALPDAARTVNREAVPKKHRIIHAPVGSTRGRLPQATYFPWLSFQDDGTDLGLFEIITSYTELHSKRVDCLHREMGRWGDGEMGR